MFAGIQTFLNALVDIPPDDDGADILFLIELMETNPIELVPLFLQIIYGRTQTAFSEDGLPIGAGLEDLGKGLRSQVGTTYATLEKGPRYLELAEGYITKLAVDENDTIIGYKFVHLGKMMESIRKGMDANEALEKASGQYGRVDDAVKLIDPRCE